MSVQLKRASSLPNLHVHLNTSNPMEDQKPSPSALGRIKKFADQTNGLSSQTLQGKRVEPTFRKLDAVEVFDRMRESICSITTPNSKGSGFFLNNQIFLTSYHSVAENLVAQVPVQEGNSSQRQLTTARLRAGFNGSEYPVEFYMSFPPGCPADKVQGFVDRYFAKAGKSDLIPLQIPTQVNARSFPIIPEDVQLKEGMKVYLAGFPFAQANPTFHRGTISSVVKDSNDNPQFFTIDGTIVAGNSGGPVLVQIEGELYLAGVIISEVADLDPDFHKVSAWLEHFGKQQNLSGFFVTFKNPDGTEEKISRDQFVIKAINTVQRNMSTGIGKAVDARLIHKLLDPNASENDFLSTYKNDFLVAKKRAQETKRTYVKDGRTYFLHPDDHGWKHVKGSFQEKSQRDFLKMTKKPGEATFYPDFAKNYNQILEESIKAWVEKGANPAEPFVTFPSPVGGDEGEETNVVEIYYGGEIGSHIRPKYKR